MNSGLLGTSTLRLPNELVLLVVEHLYGENKALCNLARTCRGMQYLAEAQIYKSVELLSVTDLQAINLAFMHRYQRARALQTLKIVYEYMPTDLNSGEENRRAFNECTSHMVNLKEWYIESPFDSSQWHDLGGHEWVEKDMERFRCALNAAADDGPKETEHIRAQYRLGQAVERTVGLALLESLTLHSHGIDSDYWDIGSFDCIFRHPNLRYLHVSCVSLPAEEMPSLATYIQKTPLTTLIFDECDLHQKSLLSILRTPASLKHLTLGEVVFNSYGSKLNEPKLTRKASESLDVLSVVAHSLESLIHLDSTWRLVRASQINSPPRMEISGEGLRNFHSLKYIECDTTSFLHRAIIMNAVLAPPNLETLRLRRHWEEWQLTEDFFEKPPLIDPYLCLPSLSTLELCQAAFLVEGENNADYICQDEFLRRRHAYGYKLWKANINFKCLVKMHKSRRYIPPFLYREPIPTIRCMYDASKVGFHRRINDDPETGAITDENLPETDQLGDDHIARIMFEAKRTMWNIMEEFQVDPVR